MALVAPTCQGSHLPWGLGAPNTLPPKEGSPQSAAGPQLRSRVAGRKGLMFRILALQTLVSGLIFSLSLIFLVGSWESHPQPHKTVVKMTGV